jgi:hypothetical protein
MTSYAIALFLFGLTLMAVRPIFAEDSAAFVECQTKRGLKKKKNCFRDLARDPEAKLTEAEAAQRDTMPKGYITNLETVEEEYKEALLAVIDGIYGINVEQLCGNLGVDEAIKCRLKIIDVTPILFKLSEEKEE